MNAKTKSKTTQYVAKQPDSQGYIAYTPEEDAVWATLYARQIGLIHGRACDAFIQGLALLELSPTRIPQCVDVSKRLQALTGWSVTPVEALISFETFFQLLANQQFPAASFIRVPEELDYLMEPDIFHEIFGHCPMLTCPAFAAFTQKVGELGLTATKKQRAMLARLYWFTVEFGLIKTPQGLRIYGGGILSSAGETEYALASSVPVRKPLEILTAVRTPYRYDEMQRTYFIINDFEALYRIIDCDLLAVFEQALQLGMLPNLHEQDDTDFHTC